jgi:hypothetical protein
MTPGASPMMFVSDGRDCVGFVFARGKSGFEGFDRDERSLGLFDSAAAAANAVFARAEGSPK